MGRRARLLGQPRRRPAERMRHLLSRQQRLPHGPTSCVTRPTTSSRRTSGHAPSYAGLGRRRRFLGERRLGRATPPLPTIGEVVRGQSRARAHSRVMRAPSGRRVRVDIEDDPAVDVTDRRPRRFRRSGVAEKPEPLVHGSHGRAPAPFQCGGRGRIRPVWGGKPPRPVLALQERFQAPACAGRSVETTRGQ